jgi:hypothetical protein
VTEPLTEPTEPAERTEVEPVEGGAAPAESSSTTRSRVPIVVAAVLLVVATFFGALAARFHSELQDERTDRRQVETVASRLATAMLTYDYRNLGATRTRVIADAAGRFKTQYEEQFRTSLSALIKETQGQSKGTVIRIYIGDIDEGSASALVVANVERVGVGGKIPVAATYLGLELVKVDGVWKVDDVTNLTFAQANARASGAAPATPTSVPTSTP